MTEMSGKLKTKYKKDTEDHAEFLCAKVFKPAFIMTFIHSVKTQSR